MSTSNISVNGTERAVNSRTLTELIDELELSGKAVAIELNREVVPRARYAETEIRSGDSLEVVQFVGGG